MPLSCFGGTLKSLCGNFQPRCPLQGDSSFVPLLQPKMEAERVSVVKKQADTTTAILFHCGAHFSPPPLPPPPLPLEPPLKQRANVEQNCHSVAQRICNVLTSFPTTCFLLGRSPRKIKRRIKWILPAPVFKTNNPDTFVSCFPLYLCYKQLKWHHTSQ